MLQARQRPCSGAHAGMPLTCWPLCQYKAASAALISALPGARLQAAMMRCSMWADEHLDCSTSMAEGHRCRAAQQCAASTGTAEQQHGLECHCIMQLHTRQSPHDASTASHGTAEQNAPCNALHLFDCSLFIPQLCQHKSRIGGRKHSTCNVKLHSLHTALECGRKHTPSSLMVVLPFRPLKPLDR